jgi:hypothetical protein
MMAVYQARNMDDFLVHNREAAQLSRDRVIGDFKSLKTFLTEKFGDSAVQMTSRDVAALAAELLDLDKGGERYAALRIFSDMEQMQNLGKPVLLFNAASEARKDNINCPYTDMPDGVRAADLVHHVEVGNNTGLLLTIKPK